MNFSVSKFSKDGKPLTQGQVDLIREKIACLMADFIIEAENSNQDDDKNKENFTEVSKNTKL